MEFVSMPGDELEFLIGDAVTANMQDILYNTYDGNLELLEKDEMSMGKYDSYVDAVFEYRESWETFCKAPISAADLLRHWVMFGDESEDKMRDGSGRKTDKGVSISCVSKMYCKDGRGTDKIF